ncbi:MAG TPA: hypothetical protein DCY02_06270 [Armatimonadetes bacterium]|nr:hypothetical protein [Armatimonadota bacterium]HCM73319.1 hypothetical protein [Armatimonadota bacterium]
MGTVEHAEHPPASNVKLLLGLSALLVALSFALPLYLIPSNVLPHLSNEARNVYACTAWAGWAHFVFAYVGQMRGFAARRDSKTTLRAGLFALAILVALLVLVMLRSWMGVGIFGAVVWIYFIDHFLKAEQFFKHGMVPQESTWSRWVRSYQPILSFGWLSIVLLNMGGIASYRWIVWGVSFLMALLFLATGGWQDLRDRDQRGTFVSLFFVAEAAVWGTLIGFASSEFLSGVYIFHIAFGSFYHYLGSYFAAAERRKPGDFWHTPLSIVLVNFAIGALGFFVAFRMMPPWLTPVLGVEWFTLWVGLHLVASDVFPMIKRMKG